MKHFSPNNANRPVIKSQKLKEFINPTEPLCQIADLIDWASIEQSLGLEFKEVGRPPIRTRVMVGLHCLKYFYNLSDEVVVNSLHENMYRQYFCGFETLQYQAPCHPTSLVKWRKKVQVHGAEKILEEVINVAIKKSF